MNGLRKRKKLDGAQLFTFAQADRTSSLILFKHVKTTRQWKSIFSWRVRENLLKKHEFIEIS